MTAVSSVEVIPLAFSDPPLLNTWGVHEPLALRSLVVLTLDDGTVGLGEASGDIAVLRRLRVVAPRLIGLRVSDLHAFAAEVDEALGKDVPLVDRNVARSPFEVAALDAWGKLEQVPVVELLGGRVRDRVDFAGYLFYKWAGHPGADADEWGAVGNPAEVVSLAQKMVDEYGFRSLKLKAGVFSPDREAAAIRALSQAFPATPLRIDPNGAWTQATAHAVADELVGHLDYLEDPVLGIRAMAALKRDTLLPLASNMIVNTSADLEMVIEAGALDVVLADHHYWGGPTSTLDLARECANAGLGLSMHSNSHLGVSLAAMTHVAAASKVFNYASDTHYPWNSAHDIVDAPELRISNGSVPVPTRPGLGVELRREVVDRLHRAYVTSGRTVRDDTGYARSVDPTYDPTLPRF